MRTIIRTKSAFANRKLRVTENYQTTEQDSQKSMTTSTLQPTIDTNLQALTDLVDVLEELALSTEKSDRYNAIDVCQQICDLSVDISAQLGDRHD